MNQESSTTSSAHEEMHTRHFSSMVVQTASMALMFMGQAPHPETGETVKDLDTAQMFIGQLEMLEAKTRGNLNKEEAALLKQSLMTTRLAFVQAVEAGEGKPAAQKAAASSSPTPAPESGEPAAQEPGQPASAAAAEERKKFVKKY